ncbi:HTH-type transcriptional regulator ArgP [Streptomyces tanashiensis]
MDLELRQLRCLVAIVDEGTFTDAALALGVSQAAVSRTLASLERALGFRLLRRTSRSVTPTSAGVRVVTHARRVLAAAEELVREASAGQHVLRIGYAWSALGRHTPAFQRRWAAGHPGTELHMVRVNSATAGLAEGSCDLAVLRRPLEDRRFDSAIVGLERRLCAMAADDPLARRRSLRLADLRGHTLLIDRRTGTTTPELWPPDSRPAIQETYDVDDWLTAISRTAPLTAEGTASSYPGLGGSAWPDCVPSRSSLLYEDSLGHSARVLRAACREQRCGFDPASDLAHVVRRDGNAVGVFNLLVIASIIDPKLNDPRFGVLDALHASAGGDRTRLNALVAGFSAPSDETPAEFSSGLHAAALCADGAWPWGDASVPVAGRRRALERAVRRIKPAATWPFPRETAGEQGLPQTCLPWPASRPNRAAPGRTLTMPVLMLAGDRDLSTPVRWARELAAVTPRAELVVLPGVGHSTQSRSDEGARAAEEFLLR